MATVLDLLKSSLRAIGQLGPGRSPGPSETADAVYVLNRMLEAWSIERLQVYAIQRSVHSLTAAQADYTIGLNVAADFNVARPVRLEDASRMDGNFEVPLQLLTAERYARAIDKTTAGQPAQIYYETSYPLGTIHLLPVPSAGSDLVLYTWQVISQVANETVDLNFPPGYSEAVAYNLAVRLGTEWSKPARPDVLALAADSLARIKSFNTPVYESAVDAALLRPRGRYDVMTGEYRP